jgi:hypothetical protein
VDGAGRLLAAFDSAAARRVGKLVAAVRRGDVSLADGAEFLRLHLAPPTTAALRSLERIADASPRFLPAREAVAWMLVKLGRYASARGLFDWLAAQPLDGEDRGLVAMGLRCVDAALRSAGEAAPRPAAGAAAPPHAGEAGAAARGSGGAGTNGAGAPDSGAVFSGRLSVFSLPDLVEFLRTARRSGLLVCSSPAGMGTMRFSQGFITGASGPGTPGLVELLRRGGHLGAEAEAALAAAPGGGEGAEAALLRGGLVEAAALEAALRSQVSLAVRELVGWSDGEFAFNKEAEAAGHGPAPVLVDAQELLLGIFKDLDESSRGPAVAGGGGRAP